MRVNREELLKRLEAVSAGLAKREIIEQSQCFVFQKGRIVTFNDEVAAWTDDPLEGIVDAVEESSGTDGFAIPAAPLLALLQKLPEDELDVAIVDGGLSVKGKGRRATIRMETEVLLPVDGVEDPGDWVKLPNGMLDAMKVAMSCCSGDESHFLLTCVHIASDRVESSDDFQILVYPIKTRLKKPTLLRRDSVAKLVQTDPTEWSETDGWLHFRNPSGLVLSCRRYMEDYPDVGKFLDVEGSKAKFPKGIDEALDKANIFSAENPVGNQVTVSLSPGRLRLEGKGPSGRYEERKRVDYDGEALSFAIEPKLLLEISQRSNECIVGDGRIKVDAGKFSYVACTAPAEEE